MTSILFCKHGGFIYPITSGQTSQVGILHLIYVAEEGAVTSGKSNDGGPAAGELINYKFTTYEPRWKFGEVTPNYYILYHKNSYVDDGRDRKQKRLLLCGYVYRIYNGGRRVMYS